VTPSAHAWLGAEPESERGDEHQVTPLELFFDWSWEHNPGLSRSFVSGSTGLEPATSGGRSSPLVSRLFAGDCALVKRWVEPNPNGELRGGSLP
jgi:hypothetical protein